MTGKKPLQTISFFCWFFVCFAVGIEAAPLPPLKYTVSIEGVKDSSLVGLLRSVSDSVDRVDNPPPTAFLLGDMARDDARKMEKVLRARGFYSGKVADRVDEKGDGYRVIFSVETGKPYRLRMIEVRLGGVSPDPEVKTPTAAEIGLRKGETGTASAVIAAGEKLVSLLRDRGYPFAAMNDRRVVVDHATRTMDVTYVVEPGERVVFGGFEVSGLEGVDEEFVRDLIPWKEGELYRPALVQKFRDRLSRSGLFSIVLVSHQKEPPPDGRLTIESKLQERERFSVGLSAGYQTDRGFGGGVFWEDRNLFGGGQKLKAGLDVSEEVITGEVSFREPQFLGPDQSLVLGGYLTDDQPDAYHSRRLRGSALLERELGGGVTVNGGAALTQDGVEQLGVRNDYTIFSVPLSARWTIGPAADPAADGAIFALDGETFYDIHSGHLFAKALLSHNLYLNVPGVSFLSLAGRAALGSMFEGDPGGEIPADLRFYAGGAGSVRGYAYQSIGPLAGDDPVGGRSLFTFSLELDAEVISGLGAAAFIDGGTAFRDGFLAGGDEILYGTGGGLRYFSPIGPIGLDIGFPLKRRAGIDSSFQIYVSIVRAF